MGISIEVLEARQERARLKQEAEHRLRAYVAPRVTAGITMQRIADQLGVSYFVVYFCVRRMQRELEANGELRVLVDGKWMNLTLKLPRKNGRPLDPKLLKEIRKLLVTTNLSPTGIARQLDIHNTYGIYKVMRLLERQATRDAGDFQPNKEKRSCPIHGKLTVWPCVACKAMEAKETKRHFASAVGVG